QHVELLDPRLAVLPLAKQVADSENGRQRIVELVLEPSDHLRHGSQAFALDNLLLQLFLDGDVAHRNNYAAELVLRIEELAGRSAHGAPAAIVVKGPVL